MDKVIIDDVDVSKCGYLILDYEEDRNILIPHYCEICGESCEYDNCYYKQLKRLDKAYRELMEDDARALARLDKAEFENRKLKRENQELKLQLDNYKNNPEMQKALTYYRTGEYDVQISILEKENKKLKEEAEEFKTKMLKVMWIKAKECADLVMKNDELKQFIYDTKIHEASVDITIGEEQC